jgi:hypothetical protein
MRVKLKERNFSQFPQLSGSQPVDVDTDFDLVPREGKSHARRAVMVGINYIGHESGVLSGCHNDVLNMKKYIMAVHGFKEENIVVLMDDGEHESPTKENIVAAYKKIVADSKRGDNIFRKYASVQVCKCASVQVCTCAVCKCAREKVPVPLSCLSMCFTLYDF